MNEHIIQRTYFEQLRLITPQVPQLSMIYAIPNGGYRDKVTAAKLKAEGVKAGVWDVCCPIAQAWVVEGQELDLVAGFYAEFKHGRNRLTNYQLDFRKDLQAFSFAKYKWFIWRDSDTALRDTLDYFNLRYEDYFV